MKLNSPSLSILDRRKRDWNSLNSAGSFMSSRSLTLPNLREGTPHGKKRPEVDFRHLILRSATTLSEVAESTRWNKKSGMKPVLITRTPLFHKLFTSVKTQHTDSSVAISRPDRCIVLRKLSKRVESANKEIAEHCRMEDYRCNRRGASAPSLSRQFCDIMGPGLCNECTKCRKQNISIKEISQNFKQMKTDRPVIPAMLKGAPAHPSIKTYLEGLSDTLNKLNSPVRHKGDPLDDSDSEDSVFAVKTRPRTESFSSRLSNISTLSREMTDKTAAVRKQRSSSTTSLSSSLADGESVSPRSRKSSVISDLGPKLVRVPTVQPVLLELKLINFTPYDQQCLKEMRELGPIPEETHQVDIYRHVIV